MKKLKRIKTFTFAFLAALSVAGTAQIAKSQTTLTGTYTQTFATGGITTNFAGTGSVAGWEYWYGLFGNTMMTNDVSMDVGGDPASGSLEVSLPFGASGNQQTFFGSFDDAYGYDQSETANGLNYTNITFYVRVASGTQPDSSGGFGQLAVGFYETGTFGSVEIPGAASNSWVQLSVPIDKTKSGINSVSMFLFDYNSYGGYPKSPITFWLDNVSLNYGGPPPAPPTLSLEKPQPGLNVIDSSPGTYDRESIMSQNTSAYSWVGASSPVTYSFTVKNYPVNQPSVAAQMFLIAGNPAIPSYETAPDYNESNVVLFVVTGNSTNANGNFYYKAFEGNGNNMIYGNAPYTNAPGTGSTNFGSGSLGSVTNTGVLGTWSMTFSQNTNITLTAPDGATANYTMNGYDASAFAGANGFVVMLGSQPDNSAAIGTRVVYSQIQVQGTPTPINDNFLADSSLNTNIWTVLASAPAGVLVVPTNTAYILDWTTPDAGYSPILGTNVASAASYFDLGLSPFGQIGSIKSTLLLQSNLPAGNQAYFRMIQRKFTQLQVLLPGETNAPGTSLGYVGSPTPVSIAAEGTTGTTVTVNACDATWHIVNVTDSIKLTTSDSAAFLPAGNVSMVNGVAVFSGANSVDFQTQGSQTVTATDSTTLTIPAATSAPVTVGP